MPRFDEEQERPADVLGCRRHLCRQLLVSRVFLRADPFETGSLGSTDEVGDSVGFRTEPDLLALPIEVGFDAGHRQVGMKSGEHQPASWAQSSEDPSEKLTESAQVFRDESAEGRIESSRVEWQRAVQIGLHEETRGDTALGDAQHPQGKIETDGVRTGGFDGLQVRTRPAARVENPLASSCRQCLKSDATIESDQWVRSGVIGRRPQVITLPHPGPDDSFRHVDFALENVST